jgi:hypothetical protein
LEKEKEKTEIFVALLSKLVEEGLMKLPCMRIPPAWEVVWYALPPVEAAHAVILSATVEIAESPAIHLAAATGMSPSSL